MHSFSKFLPPLALLGVLLVPSRGLRAGTQAKEMPLYTGLVVNTIGLHISPGMSPKIYDDSGKVVYGNLDVTPQMVNQTGIAGYAESLHAALSSSRAGANPLVVQGLRAQGPQDDLFPTSVVISKQDAERIAEEDSRSHFLANYNVIILTDPQFADNQEAAVPPAAPLAPIVQTWDQILGIDKDDWVVISNDKDLVAKVEALPPEAIKMYKSLSFFDKIKYNEDIHGTTTVLFYTIDNKQAFIDGTVMGHDIFEHLQSDAEDNLKSGKITQEQYQKQIEIYKTLSKLTPGQRSTLIALIEQELKARNLAKATAP